MYELFSSYCSSAPKFSLSLSLRHNVICAPTEGRTMCLCRPDRLENIREDLTLEPVKLIVALFLQHIPYLVLLYNSFYIEGKKSNTFKYRRFVNSFRVSILDSRRRLALSHSLHYHLSLSLLTITLWQVVSEVQWQPVAGRNKVSKYITLCTDSYSLAEVENLIKVINTKFKSNCYKLKSSNNYRIIIPAYSIST